MATKNYMINDKWLDLDKQNIVELQSVDGVLDSLKVNGSEIETPSGKITITENGTDIDIAQYALADVNVEGGGGSSDFSTAELVITNNTGNITPFDGANVQTGEIKPYLTLSEGINNLEVVLYKGSTYVGMYETDMSQATITGDIEYIAEDDCFVVTGDGTITISAE